ncbi:Metal tolerance protein 4 [Ceratocystis platani]|uniref:Metal tolerance protein 4 n=1 Tax=Ceratocystis fimbriata f. sp. platani TaxID=88771 RepID=A0A0F8CWG2_CERFI|nr:Metal tolerance protein 4 [Ceratocystis platani]
MSSLKRTRSASSVHSRTVFWHPSDDEDLAGSPSSPLAQLAAGRIVMRTPDPDEDPRRIALDGRRLSQIIAGSGMRSMRMIGGNQNPRYNWEQYWTKQEKLQQYSPPIREYYERINDLIQQYLFIDKLLDSTIPYEMLDEYSTEMHASAFHSVDIPDTIHENQSDEQSPTSDSYGSIGQKAAMKMPVANESNDATETTGLLAPAADVAPSPTAPRKRTPKDIFRAPEDPPITSNGPTTRPIPIGQHSSNAGGTSTCTDIEAIAGKIDAPIASIPWVEDAEIDSDDPIVEVAIWVNFVANAILLAGKLIVVLSVPSMSVLASLVDALLDFLSTFIVWTTTRLVARSQSDNEQYPVGRRKLEPLGVLVFAIIMVMSFFQVGFESVNRLLGPEHSILELGLPAILIMLCTIVIKGAVWLWYRMVKNSSVQALADDAITDVVFNTGSILFPIVGFYARLWWLDALGGLLLSIYVVYNWSDTAMHHARNLTGFSADPDERNLLLYLTMRFATTIKQIQNLRAYHTGDKLAVEVDIVLPSHTPLKDSHDLSEVLTYFLESVPIVDRAYVHVDYLPYHQPTHISGSRLN